MGTVFTIDIRDPGDWTDAIGEAVTWLHHVDAVFSTFKPGSDIVRMQRGELRVEDADTSVGPVLDLCADVQLATSGAFTAMSSGRIDPTGLVKGWAIEQASRLLLAHGARNHAINGGGDMQLAGEADSGRPWGVGIADPRHRGAVLTVVSGRDLAVATSGSAERGHHIIDPFTGRAATRVVSATVIGPSLTFADAYATAAVVLADSAIRWIDSVADYEALLVFEDGTVRQSRDWPA